MIHQVVVRDEQGKRLKALPLQLSPEGRAYPGSTLGAACAAFSAGGHQLAVGGVDPWVDVWNVATGRRTRGFKTEGGSVVAVVFASETRVRALAGEAVRDFDLKSGKRSVVRRFPDSGVNAFFVENGRKVVFDDLYGRVDVADVETGLKRRVGGRWNICRPDPEGKRLLLATRDRVSVVDVDSLNTEASADLPLGPYDRVLDLSMDRSRSVLVASATGRLFRWSLRRSPEDLSTVDASLDGLVSGTRLGAGGQGRVLFVIDIDSVKGLIVRRLEQPAGVMQQLVISPDERSLVTGTRKGAALWDLGSGRIMKSFVH